MQEKDVASTFHINNWVYQLTTHISHNIIKNINEIHANPEKKQTAFVLYE
jgi:hypothetical protein